MPSHSGAENFRRSKLTATLQETSVARMPSPHFAAIERINIESHPPVVTRATTMGTSCQFGQPKTVSFPSQGHEGPQHAQIQSGPTTRSISIRTTTCHRTPRSLLKIVLRRSTVPIPTDVKIQTRNPVMRQELSGQAHPLKRTMFPGRSFRRGGANEEKGNQRREGRDKMCMRRETKHKRGAGAIIPPLHNAQAPSPAR